MSDLKICLQVLNKFNKEQKMSGDKAYVGEPQITS